jgi:hypothetical protein
MKFLKLSVIFLEAYSPPETSWLITGTGLRIMQSNGAHRKSFSRKQLIEKELWKRAFWSVVANEIGIKILLR